ncbi:MAG: hypothetical protein IPH03_01170 [Tetrasphaera sp.]|nr:hypothetical protein [Tetrasphaera sp.]
MEIKPLVSDAEPVTPAVMSVMSVILGVADKTNHGRDVESHLAATGFTLLRTSRARE